MNPPGGTRSGARIATVFACAACFFLLTSGGRMASSDAFTQLQASVLLVTTGWVAADDPGPAEYCWVVGPDGKWYQAHDPGNLVLFVPAASVARAAPGPDPVHQVPLTARVAAALTYALVGAALVAVVFRLLLFAVPDRAALAFAGLFAVGTPVWVYSRSTMDVLPAALGTALAACVVFSHAAGRLPGWRAAIFAALAIVFAGWFRVSLLPFLAAPALLALAWNERARRGLVVAVFATVVAAGLAPVLAYNHIRTGHPLTLATMTPKYADQNGFAGDFATGLYGLLLSPNHGLIVFAPWLCLALIPAVSRLIPAGLARAALLLLAGAAAYTVMIAGLKHWAKVEWGPRYLVPVLPLLAVPAAATAYRLWQSRRRWVVILLAVLSVGVSLPAGVVNYSYVVTDYPGAVDPLAPRPLQVIGAYRVLWGGLNGTEQQIPLGLESDPERLAALRFPDFWTARLIERGGVARLAGIGILIGLLAGFAWFATRLARGNPSAGIPAERGGA